MWNYTGAPHSNLCTYPMHVMVVSKYIVYIGGPRSRKAMTNMNSVNAGF